MLEHICWLCWAGPGSALRVWISQVDSVELVLAVWALMSAAGLFAVLILNNRQRRKLEWSLADMQSSMRWVIDEVREIGLAQRTTMATILKMSQVQTAEENGAAKSSGGAPDYDALREALRELRTQMSPDGERRRNPLGPVVVENIAVADGSREIAKFPASMVKS